MLTSQSGVQFDMDEVIHDIDKYIFEHMQNYTQTQSSSRIALLDYELPVELRNKIAKKYLELGWKYVYHTISSEQIEEVHKRNYTLFEFMDSLFVPDAESFVVMKSEVNPNKVVVYKDNTLLYTIH